ncbi:hypothetical protein TeGR_g13747 [Tetraparma gracilis]|uniref:EGF-like domain-containing protein n=1 Tax=Tetraparma gracilis TaxID=2962635 RepID=A0ABQ6MXR5_9STRA|nr:hypothetical protein TeGR_g13747 [Tetraparma gracilis]
MKTSSLLLSLSLLGSTAADLGHSRPEVPIQDSEFDDGHGNTSIYQHPAVWTSPTQFGMVCEAENDCPVRQLCYLGYEGEYNDATYPAGNDGGVCMCSAFYGLTGPDCMEQASKVPFIVSMLVAAFGFFSWLQWIQTLYQLIKAKAFKPSTAAGTVTLMSTLGNFLTVVMNLCYGLVAGGVGLASYAINDSARPASFGINVIVTLYCVFAIPIMWMDIVIKSPGMNSDENKAMFKKAATGLRALTVFVGLTVMALLAMKLSAPTAMFFVLVLIGSIVLFMTSSRKLAVMICKNWSELGYNPSEDKFKGQAEKSGHNAAKNIMLMANRFSGSASMFIIGLVAFIITNRSPDTGALPFYCCHVFLIAMVYMNILMRGYVRLGARKKLASAGYGGSSKVTTTTTTSTAVTTKSEGGF